MQASIGFPFTAAQMEVGTLSTMRMTLEPSGRKSALKTPGLVVFVSFGPGIGTITSVLVLAAAPKCRAIAVITFELARADLCEAEEPERFLREDTAGT